MKPLMWKMTGICGLTILALAAAGVLNLLHGPALLAGGLCLVAGIGLAVLGGFLWMLIPYFKIKHRDNWRIQPLTLIGIIIVVFIIVMTILGYIL